MKKLLLLFMMLVAGIAAQATLQTPIRFRGMTQTSGNTTMCAGIIESAWGTQQIPTQQGSSRTFDNFVIRGSADITINGTLNFQQATSMTDVVTGSEFTVTVESSTLWFYGATVKTLSDASVSGCTATVSSDKHTLTVTIPSGKTFGQIVVSYATHEPISSSNTVISGVEDSYLYLGSPIEPEPIVTYYGTVLTEGTDYTVSYIGSNRVGTATLTVTGTGSYAGSVQKSYTLRNVALSDFNSLGNNTYEIATTTDLDYLALYVKGGNTGNDCEGLTFKQTADIAYSYTTEWANGGENTFASVGIYGMPFKGTYDGQNYAISGIRIYKSGESDYDGSQGLFGYVSGGTVKNVILADANIVGHKNTGGIVGYNAGTIEDCRVESNVLVKTIKETNSLGGIAGICAFGGTINRCTFKGQVQHTSTHSSKIGGVVGELGNGTVSNCLALGARVRGNSYSGAIAGIKTDAGALTANYYHDCIVRNAENSTTVSVSVNVGVGIGDGSADQAGARSVHALTLPGSVTATGETVTIDGVTHYAAATTVTLSYSGELPEGYSPIYSVNGNAFSGNSFAMPAEDATITYTFGIVIDEVNFPDANFRNWLLSQSYGSDGALTDEEIADITSIDVSRKKIADLTGIEHFTALTGLRCYNNKLTALNVSHNTALTELYCYDNQLTSLDVSQNTALTHLGCDNNQLTALDLSHNTALTHLDCYNNQINGENMEALVASLPTVDVNNNGGKNGVFRVIHLDFGTEQNVITTSQVTTARGKNWTVYGSTNGRWEEYEGSIEGLPIDSINFPDANFRDWLLSQNYGSDGVFTVEEIAGITSINVARKNIADLTGIEHFTALENLECYSNQLTSLDLSQNTVLTDLDCEGNQLMSLDVSHNTALTRLVCTSNQLDTLDLSHNTALTELWCYDNQLTGLDVSQNTALTELWCYDNQLTSLDVSQNTALTRLDCDGNQLTSLDVSQNTDLKELTCSSNQLTALDVSHNTALTWLECSDNQLTALDVSHNTALEHLYCSNNQINGGNMDALVASLHTWNNANGQGYLCVIDLDSETEQNVITTTQVTTARGKNWMVYGRTNDHWEEYNGSEPHEYVSGDLNGDGVVDVADVNICINVILERNTDPDIIALSDLNGDGVVDVADVNMIINIILAN
ncbi:MAG: leucine-rich repeat domain-containing protein [Muribaculaceae bacterium]|nr:leucine-rich repeat domain-containing protein [Muribaculaceae bacterium]